MRKKKQIKKQSKKILIPIVQKNGIKSHRWIKSINKKKYQYNRKKRVYTKIIITKEPKHIKKSISKPIEKPKSILEFEKEPSKQILDGYYISNIKCTCEVSDRIIEHDFAIREELEYMFAELHNEHYPTHTLIDAQLGSRNFHKFSGKPTISNVYATSRQKEYLRRLGYTNEEISLIKSKEEAHQLINQGYKRHKRR